MKRKYKILFILIITFILLGGFLLFKLKLEKKEECLYSFEYFDGMAPGNTYYFEIYNYYFKLINQPGCSTTECLEGRYYPPENKITIYCFPINMKLLKKIAYKILLLKDNKYEPIEYKDYKYKVTYHNSLNENAISTIYLFKDNQIKIVNEIEERICQSKYNHHGLMCTVNPYNYYEEKKYYFSDKALKIINKIFSELAFHENNININTTKIDLTTEQDNVLFGICNNNEDYILLIEMLNNLNYKNDLYDFKNNKGEILFQAKIKTLKDNYSNNIINKISKYMNNEIEQSLKYYNNINNEFKTWDKDDKRLENFQLDYQVDLININRFNMAFQLKIEGQLNNINISTIKYYQFKNNGEIDIIHFDYNNYYINNAINNFKKQELYLKNKNSLKNNWEEILKKNMLKTGNWYTDSKNINFVIDANLLSNKPLIANDVFINFINIEGNINGIKFKIDKNYYNDSMDKGYYYYLKHNSSYCYIISSGEKLIDVEIKDLKIKNNDEIEVLIEEIQRTDNDTKFRNYSRTDLTITSNKKIKIINNNGYIYSKIKKEKNGK